MYFGFVDFGKNIGHFDLIFSLHHFRDLLVIMLIQVLLVQEAQRYEYAHTDSLLLWLKLTMTSKAKYCRKV